MEAENLKKIVIGDVAKKAKVSTATVSRVINNFPGVSAVATKKVNDAINELGYIITKKINKKIGIVIPKIENPYTSNLIKEIQLTLINHGFVTFIMDSLNDPQKSLECCNTLVDSGVSGIIYIPTHKQNKYEEKLKNFDIPIVLLGRRIKDSNLCFVGSETFLGAYNGAKYLLSLGHKDILYITGDKESILDNIESVDMEGYLGFLKALKESDISFNINNLVSGDYNVNTTFKIVTDRLKSSSFTAIFTSGDVMAYGAYKAILKLGLNVPKDISILGFDNLPMSDIINLSTISQNSFGIGQNAALLLIDLIEKRKEPPLEVLLPTNICIRSTCGVCKI